MANEDEAAFEPDLSIPMVELDAQVWERILDDALAMPDEDIDSTIVPDDTDIEDTTSTDDDFDVIMLDDDSDTFDHDDSDDGADSDIGTDSDGFIDHTDPTDDSFDDAFPSTTQFDDFDPGGPDSILDDPGFDVDI